MAHSIAAESQVRSDGHIDQLPNRKASFAARNQEPPSELKPVMSSLPADNDFAAQESSSQLIPNLQSEAPFEKIALKREPGDDLVKEEVGVKEELDDGSGTSNIGSNSVLLDNSPLVGKLKIKSLASLVDNKSTDPETPVHPFFAGFDDHIRSLILNRNRFPFGVNPPLIHSPPSFTYYDTSTDNNLANMVNGSKMIHVPASRQAAYKPYVPINVPRPPRQQVALRPSFGTQTHPLYTGVHVPSAPSTSYQWPPQPTSRPLSTPQSIRYLPPTCPPRVSPPRLESTPPKPEKVSTSSSTEDLVTHSAEISETIKTEIDLGIDVVESPQPKDDIIVDDKEGLAAALNEFNNLGEHFLHAAEFNPPTSSNPVSTPSNPILTGDTIQVGPTKEQLKRNKELELPSYSTQGCLSCKYCDFKCNKKKTVKAHVEKLHTAQTKYKCFLCIKSKVPQIVRHKSLNELEHHVAKSHRGEKRWQCKTCFKTYKCQSSYKAHFSKYCSQENPYACHMCTFTCKSKNALDRHVGSHEKAQEVVECPVCHKIFKKFYLKIHLLHVHAPAEEKPFHCMTCDFAAGVQQVLDSHYKKTGHDKRFKCDLCDYRCRFKGNVDTHIKLSHAPGKDPNRWICGIDGCTVRCYTVKGLETHRSIHTLPDSELFICSDKTCGRKFANEAALKHHYTKSQHHRSFPCPDCTLRFAKAESLHNHIQAVHVRKLISKMEGTPSEEPDQMSDLPESVGAVDRTLEAENGEEDSINNFGCWLGISSFGNVDETDCDNQVLPGPTSTVEEDAQPMKESSEDEELDPEYQHVLPVSCLVECQADVNGLFMVPTEDAEGVSAVKEENDDSEYSHVLPELTCLVECRENHPDEAAGNSIIQLSAGVVKTEPQDASENVEN